MLPRYPPSAEVEEDATLGCHQGAFYPPDRAHPAIVSACQLSYLRVARFLLRHGTPLHPQAMPDALARLCLDISERELVLASQPSHRPAHEHSRGGAIIRRASDAQLRAPVSLTGLKPQTQGFLNRFHRQLLAELRPSDPRLTAAAKTADDDTLMLQVQHEPAPPPSRGSRGCLGPTCLPPGSRG